ncbi:hypothetical protein D3C75_329820 [compost metagenome]
MTKHPVTFIKGPFIEWLRKNSDGGVIESFWPIPCYRDTPGFKELCADGALLFTQCDWAECEKIDDFFLSYCDNNEGRVFCVSANGHLPTEVDPEAFGLVDADLHFLQRSAFLTLCDFPLPTEIPSRLLNGDTFESDLEQYYPKIIAFRAFEENIKEHALATYTRVLLSTEPQDSPSLLFKDQLITLALLIPEENHDWLLLQLLSLVKAKRYESLYLDLYKFLEFFFPIANVFNLKNDIKYTGSPLSLLESCRNQLSWSMNHNSGVRASLKYAGVTFAEILKETTFVVDMNLDREERERKINNFKASAMDSLAELRHSLTHQNFKRTIIDRENLIKSIESLLSFLEDAFGAYRRDILGLR